MFKVQPLFHAQRLTKYDFRQSSRVSDAHFTKLYTPATRTKRPLLTLRLPPRPRFEAR
jgi:hypothetical protein